MKLEWARRFYGLDVSAEVSAAIDERLTDPSITDLVDAHLGINYAYFGAIDKTLAGFVVLDSTGDNFTLLDLRDRGQVWFQDHETRELEVRAHVLAKRDSQARRSVSSPDLCARYQWLVWLFARPLEQRGAAIQDLEELVRNGIGRLRHVWPRRDGLEAAFERELPQLGEDPHLAIYWLLHATAFADHVRRDRVVAAIGDANELARAFVARLGSLPLAGELPIVPGFRARRSLVQTYGETELSPEDLPRACLIALEIEPATGSLVHALQVAGSALDDVAAVLARIPDQTTGTELLRAVHAKRAGAKASPHADALARMIPTSRDPWWFALEALWLTHELAHDGPALVAAARSIVAFDRYHRRALQMLVRAAQIANEPEAAIAAIDAQLELADLVLDPFAKLTQHPREWQATVGLLVDHPAAARALAWRVLQRVALNKPSPELAAWAAQQVCGDPDGIALVGDAFVAMEPGTQSGVVGAIASVIDGPDHPLVKILLACIDGPEPAASDFGAQLTNKRAKDAAIVALAPWFHTPVLFDRLLGLVERPASGGVVDLIFQNLFNPFEKAHYLVPKLDAEQAVRAGKAMVATALRHPSIHARKSAGHQLYRFSPTGAEPFLIAALSDYSAQFAAVQGPGGAVLDHGKTEHDQLEDLVANLYSAVRGLGTGSSREALLERLFAERRAYWRLGSALGEVWSPELHRRALELLAERRDPHAAGVYAYALHEFVKKGAPLVELLRLVIDWRGDTELARGLLRYAVVTGIEAALAARDYELVRRAHEQPSSGGPAIQPDAHARGRAWTDPLETKPLKAVLAAVLSGEAEAARAALQAQAQKARAAGKPNKAIKDPALGELANAQVSARLLHDPKSGEIWFRDTEGALRYFDGFEVVPAPFYARPLGFEGVAAELTGATAMSDRALWWDAKLANFREAVRIGRHVRIAWGVNNGSFERYLLRFPDEGAAVVAFAKLRANPLPGFTESDPYYVAGKGAVVRTYYVREGIADPQRRAIAVVDAMLEGVGELASEELARAEHAQRELGWLTTGGVLATLEWDGKRRRRSDQTVREWIASRVRSDGRTAAWHVEALDEIARYLAAQRIAAPLETELGPPATPTDIAAFAAARAHPVPEVLDTLWRTISSARWQLGERGMRLLAPLEVLARRPIARAAAEAYMAKLSPVMAEQFAPLLKSLDVIVETLDGKPATFVADRVAEDGRVFTQAATHVNDFWWEKSLGWMLATGLLHDLEDAVATAAPSVERLKYGQAAIKPPTKTAQRPPGKRRAVKKPAPKRAKPAKKSVKSAKKQLLKKAAPKARPAKPKPKKR